MNGTVVSLCDLSGNMVRPWADAGYECVCVDVQHKMRFDHREGKITFVWGDVRSWWPECDDVVAVFAFPPCTHLAKSGAQDWPKKGLTCLIDALQVVEACRRICEGSQSPYAIENPSGRLSTLWRKPDHAFNPSDYAGYLDDPSPEQYTKLTNLWTGNGFKMPEKNARPPVLGSLMHYAYPPGPQRANQRSVTPAGFARAVYLANAPHLKGKAIN